MRLISTGSVGWWVVMSALFSRHFVRGSDSFLLRLGMEKKHKVEKKKGETYEGEKKGWWNVLTCQKQAKPKGPKASQQTLTAQK